MVAEYVRKPPSKLCPSQKVKKENQTLSSLKSFSVMLNTTPCYLSISRSYSYAAILKVKHVLKYYTNTKCFSTSSLC